TSAGNNTGVYLYPYDRFIIGTIDSGMGYSVRRPFDIKSMSDNIRVLNMPVAISKLNTYSTIQLNNTATETVISSPTNKLQDLIFYYNQPIGMVIDLNLYMILNQCNSDVLTLRYKVNG